MRFGYARVSTDDQDTASQVAALKAAKCEQIFREKASGGRWDRPELHRLLDRLRQGDVLVVWKLDRLSRSLRDVLMIMERLGELKAGFRSLTEAIDTTTPAGRMMMQMVGAFAEFERAMLRERTKAGIARTAQIATAGNILDLENFFEPLVPSSSTPNQSPAALLSLGISALLLRKFR